MSSNPTDRVPDRVPTVSQEGFRAPVRRPCPPSPSPTEGDTVREPSQPCPATVSQPWFTDHQITWTNATNHGQRARLANGTCCQGIGGPAACPRGLPR